MRRWCCSTGSRGSSRSVHESSTRSSSPFKMLMLATGPSARTSPALSGKTAGSHTTSGRAAEDGSREAFARMGSRRPSHPHGLGRPDCSPSSRTPDNTARAAGWESTRDAPVARSPGGCRAVGRSGSRAMSGWVGGDPGSGGEGPFVGPVPEASVGEVAEGLGAVVSAAQGCEVRRPRLARWPALVHRRRTARCGRGRRPPPVARTAGRRTSRHAVGPSRPSGPAGRGRRPAGARRGRGPRPGLMVTWPAVSSHDRNRPTSTGPSSGERADAVLVVEEVAVGDVEVQHHLTRTTCLLRT